MAQDLCPSGDLFEAVARGIYFQKVQDVKSIFLQLIDAIEHCHSLGIYHRDLKLENILLKNQEGEAPHIVVSDFGLATDKVCARDRSGSQMYMSPGTLTTSIFSLDAPPVFLCALAHMVVFQSDS